MTPILILAEVAELLRVHPSTVYRMLRRRQVPAFKVGADWRFSLESIKQWMREKQYPVTPLKELSNGGHRRL